MVIESGRPDLDYLDLAGSGFCGSNMFVSGRIRILPDPEKTPDNPVRSESGQISGAPLPLSGWNPKIHRLVTICLCQI